MPVVGVWRSPQMRQRQQALSERPVQFDGLVSSVEASCQLYVSKQSDVDGWALSAVVFWLMTSDRWTSSDSTCSLESAQFWPPIFCRVSGRRGVLGKINGTMDPYEKNEVKRFPLFAGVQRNPHRYQQCTARTGATTSESGNAMSILYALLILDSCGTDISAFACVTIRNDGSRFTPDFADVPIVLGPDQRTWASSPWNLPDASTAPLARNIHVYFADNGLHLCWDVVNTCVVVGRDLPESEIAGRYVLPLYIDQLDVLHINGRAKVWFGLSEKRANTTTAASASLLSSIAVWNGDLDTISTITLGNRCCADTNSSSPTYYAQVVTDSSNPSPNNQPPAWYSTAGLDRGTTTDSLNTVDSVPGHVVQFQATKFVLIQQ
ncbi:hypothetical protein CMQ_4046 [Grosmannia clavigera kw1407]|uniref:Uncharacterized protein n=1 Tax=Grosmannia clavigera (strain kw1407 / UAMH 11150) TaxID=655863 RepID=F0X9J5_GROCL|nr:uncharacterized protein CMQ_4046 [Grosmannia clavigera kw1407]EFX05977.1 hypothetical protein CMQ_4046 [Grosmannia clavigera kw1407]